VRGTRPAAWTPALAATWVLLILAAVPWQTARGDDEVTPPGKWNLGRVPAGWVLVQTSDYQLQSHCGKPKAVALGGHLQSMLELYRRFLPMRRSMDTFVVKLFHDRREFLRYAGEDESSDNVGYWDPGHRELVAYDTGIILGHRDIPAQIGLAVGAADRLTFTQRQRLDPLFDAVTDAYVADTARVLSHEGWHQYLHAYAVSDVPMPAWLDEGIADWFATATRDSDRDATHGYRIGEVNQSRLRALRRAMALGTTVSFGTMLGYEQAQYYADAEASYAQGWSMVHFLMQHVSKSHREIIPRLLADLRDSKNFKASTETAFRDVDLDALDAEWASWALREPVKDPMAELAREAAGHLRASDFVADAHWIDALRWHTAHPDSFRSAGEEPAAEGR